MKKILIIVLLLLLIVLGVWFLFLKHNSRLVDEAVPATANIVQDKSETVVLGIDNGRGEVKTFEAEFEEGLTAFDLLFLQTKLAGIILETKDFDIGTMIETIGNVKNGDNGKYWMYYVNNEMANLAADKNKLVPGDIVEFKFEESPF